MKTPRIQRSILAILLFVALTIVFFVRLVSQNSADTKTTDLLVNNTYEVIKHIESIKAATAESEAIIRGYLLTGDHRWRNSLADIHANMLASFDAANSHVIDTAQKRRLQELHTLLQQKIQQQNSIIQDSIKTNTDPKASFDGETPVIKSAIAYSIDRFMKRHNELLAERLHHSTEAKNKALATAIIGAAVIFIFILITLLQLNVVIRRRNKAEADIRNSESKYRQLIEDAGVTMFTSDIYGTFTYVSTRCQHLTGYTVEELTGKNFALLVTPDHLERVTNIYIQQAISKIPESTTEFPIINKKGELIWVEQEAVLLYNEQGKHYGYQCVVKDITAKKEAEVRIKAADQKIRAMLSSSQEGFYMINPDHSVVMVNEAGQNILKMITGWKIQPGDDVLDFIPDSRREDMKALFARVMKGRNEETESQRMTSQGEKWYHISYFPVRDEKDHVIAVCASSKDVTERKLAERAIEKVRIEREEYQFRLQSILDNTPAIIFIKDLLGRYLIINKSFRDTFGLTDAQVIGKTDFDFDTETEATRYRKTDEEVISTLQSVEYEEARVNEDGSIQNLLLVKFPLFDKDNNIYGVGGIASDFTDKVQSRQKLIEAKKKAESAEQLQEQFLANMSHEIRTPMNGIIGMANILSGTSLNNEQKEFVDIIRQSSENLLFLINDILDLSKIKSGKLSLEHTRFRLREVLDNTLAPFYPKAKEKNIELLLSHDPAIPAEMEGDPYRLNQVLNNLLSNALKFTEKGSIRLFVKQVKQTAAITELEFSVTDTGAGIPSDKLESIFNSFEQANDSITRKYGGTGLGLAITRKLVEMQDGTIGVNSQLGKGTTFYFKITYSLAKGEAQGIMISADEQPINAGLAGKRILVAEDNEINQKVIWHVLNKEGIEVTIANDGGEAVRLLEKGNMYDLVIMDLRMPEMDGFQATAYIRQKLQMNMPIIAMTANALRNEREKCCETGMNEYLTKPFVPADLFAQLRRFLLEHPITTVSETIFESVKTTNEMYDLSYLHEMEDNEYTCEMLQLFLDTTPPMLAELKEAVITEHWEQVNAKAHKLKSNLNLLKINRMVELIQAIEFQAKKNQDTDKIPGELKQAAEQFELIRPMIEAELTAALLKQAS